MNRFKVARDRGGAALAGVQNPDGSFPGTEPGVGALWGMPIALAVSGHSDAASRVCSYIRVKALAPEGDIWLKLGQQYMRLAEGGSFYLKSTPPGEESSANPYPIAWLVEGAHRLGQFDLSRMGMDYVMEFWDPESGGFYSNTKDRDSEGGQEVYVTSICGRAALYTGRIEVARAVGGWLRRLMELQPNYPRQLYMIYSRAKGLHTEPESGEDERRYVLNQDATRDERFFTPGIAGGFLARLYMATGEGEWLELAKEYMRLAEGASDYLYTTGRAGKTAWGASLLYTLTGEGKYRDMAVRIGDNLIALQTEDGFWTTAIDSIGDTVTYNRTAEMVIWMDEIYQAVGHETTGPAVQHTVAATVAVD